MLRHCCLATLLCWLVCSNLAVAALSPLYNHKVTHSEPLGLVADGELVVGMPANSWPPFVYTDGKDSFSGPLDDFIQRVASKLGLTLRYQGYPNYVVAQQALQQGLVDLLLGVAPEQTRYQQTLVTLDIMGMPRGILLPRSRQAPALEEAKKWRWVCIRGFGACDALARLKVKEVKEASSVDEASFMVKWGLVDGYLADLPTLIRLQQVHQDTSLLIATPDWVPNTKLTMVMRTKNSELQRLLIQTLDRIPDSERRRLLESGGGIDYEQVHGPRQSPFSQDELNWLAQHPALKFGVAPTLKAMSELDKQGQFKGLVADLLKLIGERTGLRFTLVPTRTWADTLTQLEEGSLDFVPSIAPTEARRQFALFTPEYTFVQRALIGRKGMPELSSFAELKGLKVGMVEGSLEKSMLTAVGAEPVPISDNEQLLALLGNHQADYVVMAIPNLKQTVQQGLTDHYRISYAGDELRTPIAMATRLQEPMLQQILAKALLTISPVEMARLEQKWLPMTIETGLDRSTVLLWSSLGIGSSLLFVLLFVGWNRTLRKQISQRLLAEQQLNEQLTFVQTLLDSLPNMVVLRDHKQQISLYNSAYRDAFIDGPRLSEHPCLDHVLPEVRARVLEEELAVWQSGNMQEGVFDCPRQDGIWSHVVYAKQPYRARSGEILGVLTVLTDVTRLKEAEARARQAEIQLTQITDSMPGAVYQYQWRGPGKGRFLYISQGVTEILGIRCEDVLAAESGAGVLGFTGIALEDFVSKVAEHAETLMPLDLELKVERPEGERYLQIRGRFVHQDAGDLVINGVVQDITAIKCQEHELREARVVAERATQARSRFLATMSHELRTPISGMHGMLELLQMSELDDDQRYMLRNVATSTNNLLYLVNDILDFSKIEAGQLQLHYQSCRLVSVICDVIRGHATQAYGKGLKVALAWAAEVPNKASIDAIRVGQVLSNLLNNAVKFTERGEISIRVGYQGEQLEIAIRDTGIGIAPDKQGQLFTPFRQIEADITRRFGGTGLGLAICHQLVQKMAGSLTLESQPGVGSCVSFRIPLSECEWDLPPLADQEWWWFGEDAALEATMAQLGAKLRRLQPQQWLQPLGGRLIAQESLLAQTLGSDWQRQLRHSALKGIVLSSQEALRGRMGSDAWWRLGQSPLYPDLLLETCRQLSGEQATPLVQPLGDKLQGRVLVADDHPVNRALLARQLAILGIDAELVDDGEQALRAWQGQGFSLLLTDCHMPVMDGYSLTRALRAAGEQMPIIGVTAATSEEAGQQMNEAGMNDMLFKPYNLEALRQKLMRWLPAANSRTEPQVQARAQGQSSWLALFGDAAVARSMALEYLDSNRQDSEEMVRALALQDTQALVEVAHRIKGAARMVGQLALATEASLLEEAARLKQLDKLAELSQTAQALMDSITQDIGLWLDETRTA